MIIGLSGYARSGKDTVGQILVENHGFRRIAFADKMKEIALAIDPVVGVVGGIPNEQVGGAVINGHSSTLPLAQTHILGPIELNRSVDLGYLYMADIVGAVGWDVAKSNPEVRRFLQRLGTEAGRNLLGENFWVELALHDVEPHEHVVITDCRFENEAQAITERGGQVWRIERRGIGPANDHLSERGLDGWSFDFRLENNGTIEDLAHKVAHVALVVNR